jgi:hypothetical protein
MKWAPSNNCSTLSRTSRFDPRPSILNADMKYALEVVLAYPLACEARATIYKETSMSRKDEITKNHLQI